jgi:clan AA aspartic protease
MRFHLRKWHVKHVENEDYIFVDAKVANPLNPKKTEKIEFLVDTGAKGCAISSDLAEKLGLEPEGDVEVELADGSTKRVKAAYIMVELSGKKFYTWTIYDKGFTPLLGVSVMRALGFHIDTPERKVLIPYKSLKLKHVRLYTGMHLTLTVNISNQK